MSEVVIKTLSCTVLFANPGQTKEQAMFGIPDNTVTLTIEADLATRYQFGYPTLYKPDGSERLAGYIESTVQVSGIPKKGCRVLCFEHITGQLAGSVVSGENGIYRVDNLNTDLKYMLVAQYDQPSSLTAPDYAATAADWQSVIPYEVQ